jgi:RNA polymerase sigma-70 factor (ECF subfamily)
MAYFSCLIDLGGIGLEHEYLKFLTDGGDPKTILHELITTYEKDVWNFAFSLTRRFDQADDITQDVFVKSYHNLYSYRGECSVKTWLLTITRNTAYNYLKSAFLRKVTLVGYAIDLRRHNSAENEAIDHIVTEEVWRKVLQLPIKFREVLVLSVHQEFSIAEISRILNIPEGTVKSRLYHARKKMAVLLDGQ